MCQRCIDYTNKINGYAEEYYKNADNNLDNAIFDIRRVDIDRKMENYLLMKYSPERYQARMDEGFKQLIDKLGRGF